MSSDTAQLLNSLYPLAHPVTAAVLGDTKNGTFSDLVSGSIFGLELQNERCVGRKLNCRVHIALASD